MKSIKQVIVKPCPFCGNPATVREATEEERPSWDMNGKWWIVECSSGWCRVHPKISSPDELDAIAEWNTRRKANPLTYDKQKSIVEIEEC